MVRIFLFMAAVLGGSSVAAGAFASHALGDRLSEKALQIFETGARYQMYHAIALLLVALLLTQVTSSHPSLWGAGIAFIVGSVLFSGSLYGLSLSGIKILGAITPLGGLAYILDWGCLAVAAWVQDFCFK
jgi:uncharacterized membrane protein YgdD (TMEM256/DUF423 family)